MKHIYLVLSMLSCAGAFSVSQSLADNSQNKDLLTTVVTCVKTIREKNGDAAFIAEFTRLYSGTIIIDEKGSVLGINLESHRDNNFSAAVPQGIKVKTYKGTPLINAINNGFIGLAMHLITAGADVNQADELGNTPLQCAIRQGYTELAKHLIAFRACLS